MTTQSTVTHDIRKYHTFENGDRVINEDLSKPIEDPGGALSAFLASLTGSRKACHSFHEFPDSKPNEGADGTRKNVDTA